ncbi:MAG: TPM domain-containing protein [Flavobacteriia bacterium]|uniref:TPM domain-containing protein n=1 Tax=Flagellimonas sp. TaxID=2058762 RepID=UPI00100125CB|nr:MAG: TPM domain-containing protein [Flavobacteriia bacterium]
MPYPKGNLLLALLCVSLAWGQFTIPKKPQEQTSVYDYVNLLSNVQNRALEQKLIHYSDSTSTQIVVVIIATTEGEDITYLGAQWGHQWGIGQADKDNGILILLARDDRRIAINTGYGVEGALTDLMSKRIIETVIIPEFKKGDYYSGLDKGSDAIFKVLTGEFTEDRTFGNKRFPLEILFPFIIFIVIMIILWSRKNKDGGGNGGRRGSGLDIWDMIILSNMGRSSGSSGGFGSGGGFSGGGFSGGFGGGGFGGGGASGGW